MPGAGDGQNWPSGTEGSANTATTPTHPQRILVQQASSAISSLTNPATLSGDTPKKRNVSKRKFPDFSQAYSEENPFLSGDESDQWEAEEENIAAQVAMGNSLEEQAALELSDPVEELTELDYLLKDVEGEEGDAD
jgi:hypothetical protein